MCLNANQIDYLIVVSGGGRAMLSRQQLVNWDVAGLHKQAGECSGMQLMGILGTVHFI